MPLYSKEEAGGTPYFSKFFSFSISLHPRTAMASSPVCAWLLILFSALDEHSRYDKVPNYEMV